MRQFATISSAESSVASVYSPSTVFVLPTSSASSIVALPPRSRSLNLPHTARQHGTQHTIIPGHAQKTLRVESSRHASIATTLIHTHAFPTHPARSRGKALQQPLSVQRPAILPRQQSYLLIQPPQQSG